MDGDECGLTPPPTSRLWAPDKAADDTEIPPPATLVSAELPNTDVDTETPPMIEGATVTVGMATPAPLARITAAAAAVGELWKPPIEDTNGDWNIPKQK